jgi:ATP-dependent HslUV protease subunit HslV
MRTPRATTILGVRTATQLALAGDGQVTVGEMILKQSARKIRRLADDQVLAGFAGAVADALTLFEKFEGHLAASQGHLRRAAVELAREWRTDRYLRRLEAQLLIGDLDSLLILSGEGDVIEPDGGVVAIGSGSPYATAAARALLAHTRMTARQVAEASLAITGDLCIFTNNQLVVETIDRPASPAEPATPTPRRRRSRATSAASPVE